jgi:hypothetical protein
MWQSDGEIVSAHFGLQDSPSANACFTDDGAFAREIALRISDLLQIVPISSVSRASWWYWLKNSCVWVRGTYIFVDWRNGRPFLWDKGGKTERLWIGAVACKAAVPGASATTSLHKVEKRAGSRSGQRTTVRRLESTSRYYTFWLLNPEKSTGLRRPLIVLKVYLAYIKLSLSWLVTYGFSSPVLLWNLSHERNEMARWHISLSVFNHRRRW